VVDQAFSVNAPSVSHSLVCALPKRIDLISPTSTPPSRTSTRSFAPSSRSRRASCVQARSPLPHSLCARLDRHYYPRDHRLAERSSTECAATRSVRDPHSAKYETRRALTLLSLADMIFSQIFFYLHLPALRQALSLHPQEPLQSPWASSVAVVSLETGECDLSGGKASS